MIDTVLRLAYLNDEVAVFVGDSEEVRDVPGLLPGTSQEIKSQYPSFQITREDWELHGRPTIIKIVVTEHAYFG